MVIDIQKDVVKDYSFSDQSFGSRNISYSDESSLFDTRFATKEIKEFEFSEHRFENLTKSFNKKSSHVKNFLEKITGKRSKKEIKKKELVKKFENDKVSFIRDLFNFNDKNLCFTNFKIKEFFVNNGNKMSKKKTMVFNRNDVFPTIPNEQLFKNVINEFSHPLDFSKQFLTKNNEYKGFDFKGKIIYFDKIDTSNDYQTKKVVIYLIPGKNNNKDTFYTFSILNSEEAKIFENKNSKERIQETQETTFSSSDLERLDELDDDYIEYDFLSGVYGARPSLG